MPSDAVLGAGIAAAALGAPYFITVTVLLWLRREEQPIKARRAWLTVLIGVFCIVNLSRQSLALILQGSIPCGYLQVLFIIFLTGITATYITRAVDLLFRYERAGAMVDDMEAHLMGAELTPSPQPAQPAQPAGEESEPGAPSAVVDEKAERSVSAAAAPPRDRRHSSHSHLPSQSFVWNDASPRQSGFVAEVEQAWIFSASFLYLTVLFPIALMVAAMVWVWTSTDLFSDSEAFCGPSVDSRFQLAYALFLIYCAVFFVSLAVRMRAVADRFFIKKEIKFSVLVVFVLELAAALLGGLRSEEDEKQTPLSRVASILSTYALLSVAVAYPLYRSYVNPPGFKMSALAPSMSLEDFEGVLGDKETRQAFRLFLVQSLCPENLMFWEEVEKYRAGFDLLNKRGVPLKARLAWARTHSRIIYRNYIGSRAAVEVNLSAPAINEVNEFFSRYRQPGTENDIVAQLRSFQGLYDAAQREVYQLMRDDPYQRFRESDLFLAILRRRLASEAEVAALRANDVV